MNTINMKKYVATAMLAAIAGVLMSFEMSVPLMPPFYKIDLSDVPSVIALFVFGPVSAACVEVIKILIKLITVGTNSTYVGEFASLIGVVFFVIPMWLIFKKCGKTKKAALRALVISLPIRIVFSCFLNAYVSLPLYAKAYGMDLEAVIAYIGKDLTHITSLTTFIAFATVPFNLLKLSINYAVGYFVYVGLLKTNVLDEFASDLKGEYNDTKLS